MTLPSIESSKTASGVTLLLKPFGDDTLRLEAIVTRRAGAPPTVFFTGQVFPVTKFRVAQMTVWANAMKALVAEAQKIAGQMKNGNKSVRTTPAADLGWLVAAGNEQRGRRKTKRKVRR